MRHDVFRASNEEVEEVLVRYRHPLKSEEYQQPAPPTKRLRKSSPQREAPGILPASVLCQQRSSLEADEPFKADLDEEAKIEDRRRRNRIASSKAYYNRKARIEKMEATLEAEKERSARLHLREQELRREGELLRHLLLTSVRGGNLGSEEL